MLEYLDEHSLGQVYLHLINCWILREVQIAVCECGMLPNSRAAGMGKRLRMRCNASTRLAASYSGNVFPSQ
jgi:hypothetical protein